MTFGALFAHLGKYKIEVAKSAIDILMHTPQRIAGFLMVEIRRRANRRPACIRMAIQAIQAQRTVWIVHPALLDLTGS